MEAEDLLRRDNISAEAIGSHEVVTTIYHVQT